MNSVEKQKTYTMRQFAQFVTRLTVALSLFWTLDPLLGAERDGQWFDRQTSSNGYDQFHFQLDGHTAYIVVPRKAILGKPWIWRARFRGYHAEMDILRDAYHSAAGHKRPGIRKGLPVAKAEQQAQELSKQLSTLLESVP